MIQRQKGFTLIELVMVIVILGILAAFALPRFADLGGEARAASINGLAGAIKSATSIAHAKQLAANASLGTTVTLEGVGITMVNGYATADAGGIVNAAAIDTNDYDVTGGAATGGASVTFKPKGFAGACQVVYTAADAATDNVAPLTAPFTVVVTTTSCG